MNTNIVSADRLSPTQLLEDVVIVMLLDGSSSMDEVELATRDAANDFIAELQAGTPVTFSTAKFATDVEWLITETPVDAIGEAIEHIEAMTIPPVYPVIAVFTDGDDTMSHRYDATTLAPMIADRRARGWRFIAFVSGADARTATQRAGFLAVDTAEYASNGAATKAAFRKLAASAKRLISAVEQKALPPANFLD
jgi:hypothetical protein